MDEVIIVTLKSCNKVQGVFSTDKKAKEWIEKAVQNLDYKRDNFRITTWKVE